MTLEELTTFENLNNAFYDCSKISHWKESTQRYKSNLFIRNYDLQKELREGTYQVSPTTDFILNERGKMRYIQAPAIRDRIIQKVMCQKVLYPHLAKYLIYDNYASLPNRGTSFARKRMDVLLNKYMQKHGKDGYILQVDIRRYFDSIDHEVLKELLHKKIDEPKEIMDLIDYMVDSSSDTDKGLNLGSEAPQIFAIYYLTGLDNYVKSVKGMKYYGRYMDDMYIISDSKEELKELLEGIKAQLASLKLEANDKKTRITKLSHGFTFMQIKYHVDKNGKVIKRPTRQKLARERRRLKKYKKLYDEGRMTELEIWNCYYSWRNGVLKDCNACYRSIQTLDNLYDELFPVHEQRKRPSREEICERIFAENAMFLYERTETDDYFD